VLFIAFFAIDMAFAEVIVFEDYETKNYLEKDHILVERTIRLKNIGNNPIIPGELHFKLHEYTKDGKKTPSKVDDLEAIGHYGKPLKSQIMEGTEETDIVISIWEPLLQGGNYNIKMSYKIGFDPKGILFYQIAVPIEETTISIKNRRLLFMLPPKYWITNAEGAVVNLVKENDQKYRMAEWDFDDASTDQVEFEYSIIPFPKTPYKAVNIFWILVIVAVLVLSVFLQLIFRTKK